MGRPQQFDTDSVLDAALEVFRQRGYAAATPGELCARTGLGKGSLYNAFGSKRGLFERAVERHLRRRVDFYEEVLETREPVRERIRSLLMSGVVTGPDDPRRRGCLAVNVAVELGSADEVMATRVARHFERLEELLRCTLERARRDGDIDGDPTALARLVLNADCGTRVLGKAAPAPGRLVSIVDATIAAL